MTLSAEEMKRRSLATQVLDMNEHGWGGQITVQQLSTHDFIELQRFEAAQPECADESPEKGIQRFLWMVEVASRGIVDEQGNKPFSGPEGVAVLSATKSPESIKEIVLAVVELTPFLSMTEEDIEDAKKN